MITAAAALAAARSKDGVSEEPFGSNHVEFRFWNKVANNVLL